MEITSNQDTLNLLRSKCDLIDVEGIGDFEPNYLAKVINEKKEMHEYNLDKYSELTKITSTFNI